MYQQFGILIIISNGEDDKTQRNNTTTKPTTRGSVRFEVCVCTISVFSDVFGTLCFFSVSVYYVWCSCFWVWVAWQLALIHFIGDPNNLKPKQFLFSTCFQNKLSKLLLDIFNILKRVKLTLSQQLCGKNPVTV